MNRLTYRDGDSFRSSIFPLTRLSLVMRLGHRSRTESEKAWEEFFKVYSPIIYRMALHGGLSDSDAQEAVAAVMSNFASSVRRGFSVKTRFRRYLRTITNRQILREKRRQNGRVLTSELELGSDLVVSAKKDADWGRIEREERWRVCLDRLRCSGAVRIRDWAAFECLVFREVPAKEVAKRYGITPNRLYGIKHKLIQELRKMKLRLDIELGEV